MTVIRSRWSRDRVSLPVWVPILGGLLTAVAVNGWLAPALLSRHPDISMSIVEPLIWSGLAFFSYRSWRQLDQRPGLDSVKLFIAFLLGVFHVSALLIAGTVAGFEMFTTPSGPVSYLRYAIYILALLLGVETARTYLYWAWHRVSEPFAFISTTLLFFVIAIPLGQWDAISDLEMLHRVFFGFWVPALALSGVATWMAHFGGMGASLAYRLPILAFVWLVPLTPDLEWPVMMLMGTFVPLMTIGLARSIHRATLADEASREDEAAQTSSSPWFVIGGASMLVIGALFLVGVFGVRPYVVTGISMEPTIGSGDLAIVDEHVTPESLQVNDIVKFEQWNLDVVHRIVAIEEKAGDLVITTRGDNVSRVDPAIGVDQIEGRVIFVIPDLGRPALWLRGP